MALPLLVRRRLHSQRLARPDFSTPADVVGWFGAVQAQDLYAALYAVSLRMRPTTEDIVEKALVDRTIVRTWPMRGTLHFVPAQDACWMVRLLGHRVNVKNAAQYRKVGLTPERLKKARAVLVKALRRGLPVMRKDLVQALKEAGLASPGTMTALFILGYWAQEGLMCLGPRNGKQPTFVLLDEWVPRPRTLGKDEALGVLAQRYFTSHGPATVRDFAWWSGLTLAEARRATQVCGPQLKRELLDSEEHWTGKNGRPDRSAPPAVMILPAFDELTVAYKDRSAFFDPAHLGRDQMSGLGPSILVDGRVAGSWKRSLERDTVTVSIRLFRDLDAGYHDALVTAVRRYGWFLGKKVVIE